MAWVKGQGVIDGSLLSVYSSTEKAFTTDDLIGELSDISEIGEEYETQELNGYHYRGKIKRLSTSGIKDVTLTENLTKDALTKRREQYKNKTSIYTGIFDETGELLIGLYGKISNWGTTLPNGIETKLTYTMALEDCNVTDLTLPADAEG